MAEDTVTAGVEEVKEEPIPVKEVEEAPIKKGWDSERKRQKSAFQKKLGKIKCKSCKEIYGIIGKRGLTAEDSKIAAIRAILEK